jgi:hypothetical protein
LLSAVESMVGTIRLALSSIHSYYHCHTKNQHWVLWLSDLAAVEIQLPNKCVSIVVTGRLNTTWGSD